MRLFVLTAACMLPLACVTARAQSSPGLLTVEEAKDLCYTALPAKTKRLPGLYLDTRVDDPKYPGCAIFNIVWSTPTPGNGHVDFYYVDRRTANVWRGLGCERVDAQALMLKQKRLRKQLGIGSETQKHAANPCCIDLLH